MSRPIPTKKTPEKPWVDWIERDDRSWLKALSAREWSSDECHKSLGSMLDSIVTSLHFSCHSRWGLQPSPERLRILVAEFLDWMRESKEWPHIENDWKKSKTGPWSLPLALSRSYVRFREGLYAGKDVSKSVSAARGLLELPSPLHTAGVLSDAILDAFNSMSHQLPYEMRLSYQLHMEGLLVDEIAALLGFGAGRVQEHIAHAKGLLTDNIQKRSSNS